MTDVLMKEGHLDTERAMGRGWQKLEVGRHTPRCAWSFWKLGQARKDSPLQPSEGAWPCQPIACRRVGSRTMREDICIVLSHLIRSNFLQQSQGTKSSMLEDNLFLWVVQTFILTTYLQADSCPHETNKANKASQISICILDNGNGLNHELSTKPSY